MPITAEGLKFYDDQEELDHAFCLAASGSDHRIAMQQEYDLGANIDAPLMVNGQKTHAIFGTLYNIKALTWMLEHHADPDVRDGDGKTPLIRAVTIAHANLPFEYLSSRKDRLAVVSRLLEADADLTAYDHSAYNGVYYAIEDRDDPALLELLLDAGASLEAPLWQRPERGTPSTRNPLLYAMNHGRPKCFKLMLARGADLHAKNGFGGPEGLYALYRRMGELEQQGFSNYPSEAKECIEYWEKHHAELRQYCAEIARGAIPSSLLFDGEKPSHRMLQIGGAAMFEELFLSNEWRDPSEAYRLYHRMHQALPPHYRTRLEVVDLRPPPQPEHSAEWVSRAKATPLTLENKAR